MVQTAPDTGRFLRVNPAFCETLGYTAGELLSMRFLDVTHPDDRVRDWHEYEALVRGDTQELSIENRYLRKDGQVIWAHTQVSTLRLGAQQARYAIAVIRDITSAKRAEAEMIHARELAENASRAKDEFLAVLSHELRTPLTPVLSAAAALSRRAELPKDVRDRLSMIQRNIELESRLIDDLLDLTRISQGKLDLRFSKVACAPLIEHALEICSDEIDAKSLDVSVELAGAAIFLYGDAADQVLRGAGADRNPLFQRPGRAGHARDRGPRSGHRAGALASNLRRLRAGKREEITVLRWSRLGFGDFAHSRHPAPRHDRGT
jgi:two-component system CheB/CheR fusion protein